MRVIRKTRRYFSLFFFFTLNCHNIKKSVEIQIYLYYTDITFMKKNTNIIRKIIISKSDKFRVSTKLSIFLKNFGLAMRRRTEDDMRTLINLSSESINYISGGLFISNGQWKHPRIILDDFELIVVLSGRFSLIINGEKKELSENDSLILFPGEEHYGNDTDDEKVSFYWLHFTFNNTYQIIEKDKIYKDKVIKEFQKIEDFPGVFLKEEFTIVEIDRIKALIKQLLDYESNKLYSKRPCKILMELILMELTIFILKTEIYKCYSKDRSFMIGNVCDWIRANIYQNISIQELSDRFGYNVEYFSRKFKKELGISPKQYILSVQIEKAKALLCTTDLKLKQIASNVGIEDDKMFLKKFKKYECMTPTQYKKIFKKTHYNSR